MSEGEDPCPKVRSRAAFDARSGKTTSEAAKDFIRRTCKCDACAAGRAAPERATTTNEGEKADG